MCREWFVKRARIERIRERAVKNLLHEFWFWVRWNEHTSLLSVPLNTTTKPGHNAWTAI